MRGQRSPDVLVAIVAALFLCLHLLALRPSLEDIDSINFALGVQDYDVARHQPHPPGYPLYIAAVRVAVWLVGPLAGPEIDLPALGLVLTSALSGAAAIWLVYRVFCTVGLPASTAALAAVLMGAAPLTWLQAARPLSDMIGLAAALGAQLAIARMIWSPDVQGSTRRSAGAGLATGLAAGVRSQVVWLTLPLLTTAVIAEWRQGRRRNAASAVVGALVGAVVWFVPLVVLSGGPASYAAALGSQAGEDFAGVAMLATHPGLGQLVSGLWDTFISPWGTVWLALPTLGLALAGSARLTKAAPRVLAVLSVAWLPYAVFHLLFQETETTRYALPLLPLICACAAVAVASLPPAVRTAVATVLIGASLGVSGVAAWQYRQQPADVFSASGALQAAAAGGRPAAVLMHRRVFAESRRMRGVAPALPAPVLPAPPAGEWLQAMSLWTGGETRPIWWLVDPRRGDRVAVDPRSQHLHARVQWPEPAAALLGGMRPHPFDWYIVTPPAWVIADGWALTPELAGHSEAHRAAGAGAGAGALAYVRRPPGDLTLLVGGRHIAAADDAPITMAVGLGTRWHTTAVVGPGAFRRVWTVSASRDADDAPYEALVIQNATPGHTALSLEQFDAQPVGVPVVALGDGWFEPERDTRTGRTWRWMSDRALVEVWGADCDLDLVVRGTYPRHYWRAPQVTIAAAGQTLWRGQVSRPVEIRVRIPRREATADHVLVELTTNRAFVAGERHGSADARRLALEVHAIAVAPAGGGRACEGQH